MGVSDGPGHLFGPDLKSAYMTTSCMQAFLHAASCSPRLPASATDLLHVKPLLTVRCQAKAADDCPQVL